ncbi:MAG: N-acetylmuramoyl-L-alanine amidase [Bacteroidales bacterium]
MPLKNNNSILALLLSVFLVANLPCFSQNSAPLTPIKTIVIDPGHGGKHPGAISGRYQEKHITLSVGLKLGALIKDKYPDIKIVYTRTTDQYVDLDERAEIANRNKADLFISIHVNATKSSQASGTETFVMGTHKSDDNFEVCKTENSVIVMEDNYQAKYAGFDPNSPESYIIFTLLQNTHLEQSLSFAAHIQDQFRKGPVYTNRGVKQGGLLVLWKTTMPAILTEIGFISNAKDRSVIITESGQQKFAEGMFNAFVAYKADYEKESRTGKVPAQDNAPVITIGQTAATQTTTDDFYAIQILSVTRPLKSNATDLKGITGYQYCKAPPFYKYYIGNYSTREEASNALSAIRKQFSGAFVIHIRANKIVK